MGKTTQVELLARDFDPTVEVIVTREPGGVAFAETIRDFLLSKATGAVAQTLLFAAARSLHVDEVITPALARGATVISDRYWPSTYVYQGSTWGMDQVRQLQDLCGHPVPDEVIVLCRDAPLGELSRLDPFERADARVWKDRMELYRQVAKENQWRCVDANDSVEVVHKNIVTILRGSGLNG